jgi:thymidylate synthase ThyX
MRNIEVGITDKFDPEVQAMLLAMYSRSYAPIATRLPDTEESAQQHKEKLGKYYVQWGHKSVGQLGVTTVWLEGVSQLAAKAIENHPLFNGQESSTRYIDYSNQPMVFNNNQDIKHWQEKWREFYIKAKAILIEETQKNFPFADSYPDHENMPSDQHDRAKTTWKNTINARVFDICRGFLPAGSTTNVGFMGTFDTLNDHFGEMLYHPCQEMRDIANEVLIGLKQKYPYGTMDIDQLKERFSYVNAEYFYTDGSYCRDKNRTIVDREDFIAKSDSHAETINSFLINRKKGQKLDRVLSSRINFTFRGFIDFGSYRDLHRHRAGVCDMNILTTEYGINPFYYNSLTNELKEEFDSLSLEFNKWLISSEEDIYHKQYCIPMGYQIPVSYKCDINQAMYVLELRTAKTVHNSLRVLMHEWAEDFITHFGSDSISLHVDWDKDNFTLKRGTQTIVEQQVEIIKRAEIPTDTSIPDLINNISNSLNQDKPIH